MDNLYNNIMQCMWHRWHLVQVLWFCASQCGKNQQCGTPGKNTPPKFNIAPEKWWLEDKPFLLGFGCFSGANCSISGWYQESQRSCITTFNHGSFSEHRTMALIRSCWCGKSSKTYGVWRSIRETAMFHSSASYKISESVWDTNIN